MTRHPATRIPQRLAFAATIAAVAAAGFAQPPADPLPSWNDGEAKRAIVAFVERVTKEGSRDFVPPADRIATFDNDGTLWCEQPLYFQFQFALDRVKAVVADHPEWKDQEPFKALLAGDRAGVAASGEKGLLAFMEATHAGMTTDEFDATVREWFRTARHPRFGRRYNALTYQPMVELLGHLRANGFTTFIVSGGGIDFMRGFAEDAYGVPPQQIVGSSGKLKYELRGEEPVLLKLPEVQFVDDGPGKPAGIEQHIGRRPLMAFGNSDGDYEMLRYTTAGDGPRFGLIVHHDDAEREYAYDRDSNIGRLAKALDEAPARGWAVVGMKNDWKAVFAAE